MVSAPKKEGESAAAAAAAVAESALAWFASLHTNAERCSPPTHSSQGSFRVILPQISAGTFYMVEKKEKNGGKPPQISKAD